MTSETPKKKHGGRPRGERVSVWGTPQEAAGLADMAKQVGMSQSAYLRAVGMNQPMRSVGDSYDNALAETINGPYKAEVIHRRSWRNREQVELATLDRVHWFNHKRLLGPIGHIRPVQAEAAYYRQQPGQAKAA